MIESEEHAQRYIAEHWGNRASADCADLVAALKRENAQQNLVSQGSLEQVWVRHIADSAQLLQHAPSRCETWIDIGTGAGFPGLVLAILRRDLMMTLVEPRRLRVAWLERMRDALQLDNCHVIMAKAEDLPAENNDVISARAVAKLADLLRMTGKLGGPESHWIFAKGRNAKNELEALPVNLERRYVFHVKHSLTAADAHIIVGTRTRDRS